MTMRRGITHLTALVVGLLAACSGADAGTAGDSVAGPATFTVTGTDGLAFDPDSVEVAAGTVEVRLTAGSGVGHTLVIEGVAGDAPVASADAGDTATGNVELDAGSYTYYCSVPGHRAAGMEGTVTAT